MQYPFWYVLAHRRGERYDLTPLYIGGVHIYGLYGNILQVRKICELNVEDILYYGTSQKRLWTNPRLWPK